MQPALVQLLEGRSTGRAHDLADRRAHFARPVELEIVPGVAHGANRTARESNTTVGEPSPLQERLSLRSPMETSRGGERYTGSAMTSVLLSADCAQATHASSPIAIAERTAGNVTA
jgi:hypothetical protein